MIPNDIDERRKMIERMIRECENTIDTGNSSLSKWEEDFITSIEMFYTDRKNLSDKQCEILEKIYDKI